MINELNLKERLRSIFTETLLAVDAGGAVRNAVKLSGSLQLTIGDQIFDLNDERTPLYAVALGKAAYPMALALEEILGDKIRGGVVSGVLPEELARAVPHHQSKRLSGNWQIFAGGHPLPNEGSLMAARSCIKLLRRANHKQALIIFLISGGGSAMIEAPVDDSITLSDLRQTNRILVSCGALITEVNTLRRAFSLIKGGGLASFAPNAKQISLLVSDTASGEEASVASGPTIESISANPEEIISIIERYKLGPKLPASILNVLLSKRLERPKSAAKNLRRHFVLLDNQTLVKAAAERAVSFGFVVEVADNINEQPVEEGCREIFGQMQALQSRLGENKIACLISGGEFSCPVRGSGIGGRNVETALRMALLIDENRRDASVNSMAFLSGGTDGIDGNSPAAGATSDNTTIERARALGLDAGHYLETSDAYTFFRALDDAIITGPTGTNVRDLRIMLAGK